MKKEAAVLVFLLACAVLAFSAADARATAVSANQALVDWTSLSITGNATWTTQYSNSVTDASDDTNYDDDSQFESGWVDSSAYASVASQYGSAYTSDDDLYAETYAIATPATTMWAYSDASGSREVYFTANADGWITFTLDYELLQNLSTDYTGELSQGGTTVKLSLWHRNEDIWTYDTKSLENTVTDGDFISGLSENGTATVTDYFTTGQLGYFSAAATNYTWVETIPEPATAVLLGLGALILRKRRK